MSAEQTVREFLDEQLTELLPATWRIIRNQTMPDRIDATTVVLGITRITKLPEAPRGCLVTEATVLVASPITDAKRAENALDDAVLEVCHALNDHPRIVWDEAKKVQASDQYFGWDISIKVLSSIKPPATPEPVEEQP